MAPKQSTMTKEQLVQLLADAGISQAELSRRIGYSARHVNRWCKGTTAIPSIVATVLRQLLAVKSPRTPPKGSTND